MMIFWWIIILIPLVAVVWWAMSANRAKPPPSSGRENPLKVLEDRYARGEISKEEFEEKKKALSG